MFIELIVELNFELCPC